MIDYVKIGREGEFHVGETIIVQRERERERQREGKKRDRE